MKRFTIQAILVPIDSGPNQFLFNLKVATRFVNNFLKGFGIIKIIGNQVNPVSSYTSPSSIPISFSYRVCSTKNPGSVHSVDSCGILFFSPFSSPPFV
jgi:hypothetical protein